MLSEFLRSLPGQPRRVFLLDGCGALLTAAGLLVVVRPLEPVFGVAAEVLWPLSAVALGLAAYSFSCWAGFSRIAQRARAFLAGIAVLNVGYCVATWAVLISRRGEVTALGYAWFAVESAVVLAVIRLEWLTARMQAVGPA